MAMESNTQEEYSESDKKRLRRERDAARKREERRNNPGHVRAIHRAYYNRNRDKIHKQQAMSYQRNKERWKPTRLARGKRRINVQGRISVSLWHNPRTGQCSECGKRVGEKGCKRTHMHHALGYITCLPWFGLKELCVGCHMRLENKLSGRGFKKGHKPTVGFKKGNIPWNKKLANDSGTI